MVHLPKSKFPIVKTESTFKNIWGKLCRLFPFLWPKQSVILQIQVVLCLLALVAGRVVNLYVPIYSKLIVDSLSLDPAAFRWDYAVTYCFLKFLEGGNGNMGALSTIREFLWIRIQQFTAIKIQVELLKHLHSLPLRWHLNRKTGQVVKVMDRGSDSIDNLLSYILFLVSPTIIDIIIAILYLISQFNIWFGLIVFVTMSLYILATIGIIEWRTKYHRRMNEAENEQKAQAVDSLLNYETVKYFGMEHYECSAYRDVIQDFQRQEWLASVSLNLLYIVQNIIICGGLLAGSLLCIRMVSFKEGLTVGDYVLFSSYIIQLYVPLNSFGSYYRSIQKYFVDMENMFELFNETSEVKELSNAPDLVVKKGTVEFRNVHFGYTPERIVLKDVSFTVPTGKTIALVGPSGGGKSTIVRLLFRFYDVNKGQITIDGQDIRDVSAKSLWASLGVVPQDVVLFNNSLLYNIEYGRKGASTSEVLDAAKSADIHNRILSFSNAYETQVGERGLRLSGGEKQRIAIARTLLKDPAIVLLDEATSALDTNTERNIQESLMKVCANRTTLIIAHRLSTIIHADEILVLKDGTIVERGRHEDLISQQGVYAKMWQQQLENSIVRRKVSKESIPKEENLDNLSRSSSHNRRRRSWHGMSYKKHSHDY